MFPNLQCKFVDPKIILCSFKILIYGRWYNPASGLLELSKIKVTYAIKEIINEQIKVFLSWSKFIWAKKYITNNKHKEFTYWFRLVKKFKNSDTNEIKTIPNRQFSMKSLPSLRFKNFELIINPIDIKVNAHR